MFVSHATADKWIATIICEKIEETGATTFRDDRDIAGGDDIPDRIRKEIIGSQELLVLLTPESVNRPWVLLEVGAFWGRSSNAKVVMVLCHTGLDVIPDIIKSKKALPINELPGYLSDLKSRVKAAKETVK